MALTNNSPLLKKGGGKFYTSYSKLSEVKLITIGLASPERIKQWAEKTLPNGKILGEVINANTLHHKSFKPQKGGLFCERIFGPLKDFECACGKPLKSKKNALLEPLFLSNKEKARALEKKDSSLNNKSVQYNPNQSILGDLNCSETKTRKYCNTCEVEYTWSVMRRYQLGYIQLISPVTHVWYLKGNPSYLSILLDIKKRHLEYITYCSETLTIENALKGGTASSKSSDIVSSWNQLKQQILFEKEKTANLKKKKARNPNWNIIKNKIEKREKLNLKKYKFWEQFYNESALQPITNETSSLKEAEPLLTSKNPSAEHTDSLKDGFVTQKVLKEKPKDWYSFLSGSEIQMNSAQKVCKDSNASTAYNMSSLDLCNFKNPWIPRALSLVEKKKLTKAMKFYASKMHLKKLTTLWLIISQSKQIKVKHNLEALISRNGSSKQVLKKLSIPFYIILHLNKNQKALSNTVIDVVWKKISEKALKKALSRVNTLFKKIDSISFQPLFFCRQKNQTNKGLDIYKNLAVSLLKLKGSSDSLTESQTLKSLGNEIQTMKMHFHSLLQSYLPSSQFEKELISGYYNEKKDLQYGQIHNKKDLSFLFKKKTVFFIKSFFALEFYTLSNFPTELINVCVSDYGAYSALKIKALKKTYKILLKNLTHLFFNLFFKNISSGLKSSVFYNWKDLKNLVKKGEASFNFEKSECSAHGFFEEVNQIKKQDFKNFKRLLSLFLEKFSSSFVDLDKTSLKKAPPFLTSKNSNHTDLDPYASNTDYLRIQSLSKNNKKLYNNFYCLSHRERWEVDNDWNFFYYFMTAPFLKNKSNQSNIEGQIIPNYKNQYENEDGTPSSTRDSNGILTDQKFLNSQKSAFFSGPGIVQQLLTEFNFFEIKKMDKQNRILLYQLNKQIFQLKKHAKHDRTAKKELKESYKKRDLLIRRTKLVRKLFIKESAPQDTILTVLPVLPPDLRPIVKMGGQIAASDLNRLYQRVLYRNDRLKKFLKDPATSHSYEMKYAQRLLQEAVDNLIQNGKSGVVSEKDSRGRALKSLSDILKGKQGRFRQYLLGKRVDYSGRTVIVVGPKLKLHECGIPKEMAIELYLPFLLKRILNENLAKTVVGAKTLIKTNPSLIWELLREIMQTCPVLLNRAPTLHRLGIQAFQPKLIEGRAILLHPLVCSAFNADFDGDQMAVHVPITVEARAEAWKLMLSRNNIVSPATGDPLAIPSQDMVLGCYYLTTNLLKSKTQNLTNQKGSGFYYLTIKDALKDYELNKLDLHSNLWLKWDGFIENGSDQEEPIEIRVDSYGNWNEIYNQSQKSYNSKKNRNTNYILTTPGKILFNQIIHTSLTFQKFK